MLKNSAQRKIEKSVSQNAISLNKIKSDADPIYCCSTHGAACRSSPPWVSKEHPKNWVTRPRSAKLLCRPC